MNTLKKVLMRRDQIGSEYADELIQAAKRRVLDDGEDPEDVLRDEFGLEPDYVFDLLDY
jgi:hypothetical protein